MQLFCIWRTINTQVMEREGSGNGWHGPNLNLNAAILLSGVFKKGQMDVAVSRKSVVMERLKMDSALNWNLAHLLKTAKCSRSSATKI